MILEIGNNLFRDNKIVHIIKLQNPVMYITQLVRFLVFRSRIITTHCMNPLDERSISIQKKIHAALQFLLLFSYTIMLKKFYNSICRHPFLYKK